MARARAGRYPGFKAECTTMIVQHNFYDVTYCTRHGCYLLECETCGRPFHAIRPHTRHCSTSCSQYAYRQRRKAQE